MENYYTTNGLEIENLDINEHIRGSHDDDRTPHDLDDDSVGHYHNNHFHYNREYGEHHV